VGGGQVLSNAMAHPRPTTAANTSLPASTKTRIATRLTIEVKRVGLASAASGTVRFAFN